MTKIGLEHIANEIRHRIIDPPYVMDIETLQAWLNGYAKCQADILELIGSYMEDEHDS